MLRIFKLCIDIVSALFVVTFIACGWFVYLVNMKSYSMVINIYYVATVGFVFGFLWLLFRYLPLLQQRYPLAVRWHLPSSNHLFACWATNCFVAFRRKLISLRVCRTLYFVSRSRQLDGDAIPFYSPVGIRSRNFLKN